MEIKAPAGPAWHNWLDFVCRLSKSFCMIRARGDIIRVRTSSREATKEREVEGKLTLRTLGKLWQSGVPANSSAQASEKLSSSPGPTT